MDISERPIVMIPGPTEYYTDVLVELGKPSESHVSPKFIKTFGDCLRKLRNVFLTKSGQPFILSGSGSLGWEFICANFIERGDRALVLNTGYFGDSFTDCLNIFGAQVTEINTPIGSEVSTKQLETALSTNEYKIVTICQVDTSTAVLSNVKELAAIIRDRSPNSLIAVDGVCSFGAEEFRFDEWDIDLAFTGCQKAIGVPPGLMMAMISKRAMSVFETRKTKPSSYYASLSNWLPIMNAYEEGRPSYFATPATNLICALNVALDHLLKLGMEEVFLNSKEIAKRFRNAFKSLGLEPVASGSLANTLSAVKYPGNSFDAKKFLQTMTANGVIIAGGLHKKIKATYFRIGHMGVSCHEYPKRTDLVKTITALELSLEAAGVENIKKGVALEVFNTDI